MFRVKDPEDRGSRFSWIVGIYLPNYMVSQPTRTSNLTQLINPNKLWQRRETVHKHVMVDKVHPPKSSDSCTLKHIVSLNELFLPTVCLIFTCWWILQCGTLCGEASPGTFIKWKQFKWKNVEIHGDSIINRFYCLFQWD